MIDVNNMSISDLADNLYDALTTEASRTMSLWLTRLFEFEEAQHLKAQLEARRAAEQAKLDEVAAEAEALRAAKAAKQAPVDYAAKLPQLSRAYDKISLALSELDSMIQRLEKIQPPPRLAAFERWAAGDVPNGPIEPLKFHPKVREPSLYGRVIFEHTDGSQLAR